MQASKNHIQVVKGSISRAEPFPPEKKNQKKKKT